MLTTSMPQFGLFLAVGCREGTVPSAAVKCIMQERLFPNCSFPTVSTSFIICNNNWGKSIGRTRDIVTMNHHINNLKDDTKRRWPTSALRMHHHTIRSLEDAQIKVRVAAETLCILNSASCNSGPN